MNEIFQCSKEQQTTLYNFNEYPHGHTTHGNQNINMLFCKRIKTSERFSELDRGYYS